MYVKFSFTVMNVHHNAHSDVTVDNRVYVEMAFFFYSKWIIEKHSDS